MFTVAINKDNMRLRQFFIWNACRRNQHPILITYTDVTRCPLVQSQAGHFQASVNNLTSKFISFH